MGLERVVRLLLLMRLLRCLSRCGVWHEHWWLGFGHCFGGIRHGRCCHALARNSRATARMGCRPDDAGVSSPECGRGIVVGLRRAPRDVAEPFVPPRAAPPGPHRGTGRPPGRALDRPDRRARPARAPRAEPSAHHAGSAKRRGAGARGGTDRAAIGDPHTEAAIRIRTAHHPHPDSSTTTDGHARCCSAEHATTPDAEPADVDQAPPRSRQARGRGGGTGGAAYEPTRAGPPGLPPRCAHSSNRRLDPGLGGAGSCDRWTAGLGYRCADPAHASCRFFGDRDPGPGFSSDFTDGWSEHAIGHRCPDPASNSRTREADSGSDSTFANCRSGPVSCNRWLSSAGGNRCADPAGDCCRIGFGSSGTIADRRSGRGFCDCWSAAVGGYRSGSALRCRHTEPECADLSSEPGCRNQLPDRTFDPARGNRLAHREPDPAHGNRFADRDSNPACGNRLSEQGWDAEHGSQLADRSFEPESRNRLADRDSEPESGSGLADRGSEPRFRNRLVDRGSDPAFRSRLVDRGSDPGFRNRLADRGSDPAGANRLVERGSYPACGDRLVERSCDGECGGQLAGRSPDPARGSQSVECSCDPGRGYRLA